MSAILLCSECGIVGGTDSVAECPNCGSKRMNRSRQAPPRQLPPQPKFHTASRLRLDPSFALLTYDNLKIMKYGSIRRLPAQLTGYLLPKNMLRYGIQKMSD